MGSASRSKATRYSEPENEDGPRFAKVAKRADGKRLTYRALTAKQ